MLDFACDKNNTELDKKQEKRDLEKLKMRNKTAPMINFLILKQRDIGL